MNKLNRHVLRQALDALPSAALIVDALSRDRPIVYANPAVELQAGLPVSELLGRSFNALAAEPPDVGSAEPWLLRTRAGAVLELVPTPLYEQPGRAAYWLLQAVTTVERASPVAFEPAATGNFTATGTWVRLPRDERTDPATGIPTRAAFLEVLARDQSIARREARPLSVIVLRIDAFESYHALFGRHACDSCLRKVGHSITNSLRRAADYCARVGHDRFAVLISGAGERKVNDFAEEIARRVRDLAIHHPRSRLARYVTVSHGIAMLGPAITGESDLDLLERAEADIERRSAAAALAVGRESPEAGIA